MRKEAGFNCHVALSGPRPNQASSGLSHVPSALQNVGMMLEYPPIYHNNCSSYSVAYQKYARRVGELRSRHVFRTN